jgi:hypothetical protein
MARIRPCLFPVFAVILCAAASVSAQSGQSAPSIRVDRIPATMDVDDAAQYPGKQLRATVKSPPFSFGNGKSGVTQSIRFLSSNEMSREDQDLVADAQSAIEERAGFQNMEFESRDWTYREVVCPALPNHMFLRFTRDDGTRRMSMFSAAIPRNGNGRVRIIPIVRKGYSLFSPAPVAALTMAAFNRIRTEEGATAPPDWLGTGVCYAALAGANPKVGDMTMGDHNHPSEVLPPTLTITAEGGATVSFVDVEAMPKPMQWTMAFDPRGKLLKAEHSPAYVGHFEKLNSGVKDLGQAER